MKGDLLKWERRAPEGVQCCEGSRWKGGRQKKRQKKNFREKERVGRRGTAIVAQQRIGEGCRGPKLVKSKSMLWQELYGTCEDAVHSL